MAWTAGGAIWVDLALIVLWLGTFAAQATLLGLGWRGFRRHWAATVWVGPVVLLLQLPHVFLMVGYLDVMALEPALGPRTRSRCARVRWLWRPRSRSGGRCLLRRRFLRRLRGGRGCGFGRGRVGVERVTSKGSGLG